MTWFYEVETGYVVDLIRITSCFIERDPENTKRPWRILFVLCAEPNNMTRCISVGFKRKCDAELAFSLLLRELQEVNKQ